ncbi:MAG: HaeIII family restriction endonuclease [Acidobacteria bacterium]|nr:HaeIII family restriction endonuclease [Acidobacteriota bacterium]
MPTQTESGKAFEYAVLDAFFAHLKPLTPTIVNETLPFHTARDSFELFGDAEKLAYRRIANAAVAFIVDLEPRLLWAKSEQDVLTLEIVPDSRGQAGDVRDVLAIRRAQGFEIGVSAKNNHRAVKHQRLSNSIDFGRKWVDLPCSQRYKDEIRPVFDRLARLRRESDGRMTWAELGDFHTSVYLPILNAFRGEILRLEADHGSVLAERLVEYLVGRKDFYKVIKGNRQVEIQAFNLHGTLNQPARQIQPKIQVGRVKMPSRIIEVVRDSNSKTTLLFTLNNGWQISFRIHSASSRIESSLKFDVNLVSSPHTLFTHHISVNEV